MHDAKRRGNRQGGKANDEGDRGHHNGAINALAGLAAAAAIGGAPARAAMLWGAATALRESYGIAMPPSERDRYVRRVAIAQARLDPMAWVSAWAQGQALSLEQAVEYALGADEITAGRDQPAWRHTLDSVLSGTPAA